MKVSYQWLKDYLDFDVTPQEVAEILTNTGLEVEGIEQFESVKGGLEGVVIGEVLTCEKHPNADNLSVTTVDIGEGDPLPIVCGAPNVAAGQKVPVAKVGTTLYKGNEELKLKKTKIRGEISEGMICAEDELGLGDNHEGIMVLDEKTKPGTPAKDYFNITKDTVFEIGLTPNRIDGASHIGAARDLSAYLSVKVPTRVKYPDVSGFRKDNDDYVIPVEIINEKDCPRYAGVTISNVKIQPSPEWLQNRLKAIGLNPINNVVDITNYVLFETGQPLHAFDADKIAGNKIVVTNAREGDKFKTLDEMERTLSGDDLMICDAEKPLVIAGVLGGMDSGITNQTSHVFLECAYFEPSAIRRKAKRYGISTDSSFRFERGVDPNNILYTLKRAAQLIKEIAGGTISSDIQDEYPNKINNVIVDLELEYVHQLIGKTIDKKLIKDILASLDFEILEEKQECIKLKVPTYRVDVTRQADVVEELLRIYGYNNVEVSEQVQSSLSYVPKPDNEKLTNIVSDYLTNVGFNEIMANSLTRESYYQDLKSWKAENLVRLYNPLSSDMNVMRQSLIFSGLEAIQYNQNRQNYNLKLFEFGNCYFYHATGNQLTLDQFSEENHLSIILSGLQHEPNWIKGENPVDYYELKHYVENIFQRLGLSNREWKIEELENDIYAEGLRYVLDGKVMADSGRVRKNIRNMFDINNEIFFAEIKWDNLFKAARNKRIIYREVPRFPEVRRDLALVLDKQVKYRQIENLAFETEKNILKRLKLFDVYEGEKIEEGKKSYAISFILQDESKTLTDKRIDKVMQNLLKAFENRLGAQLR